MGTDTVNLGTSAPVDVVEGEFAPIHRTKSEAVLPFRKEHLGSKYGDKVGRAVPHRGIDLRKLAKGTPVPVVKNGTVEYARYHRGYGYTIAVRHESGHITVYAHLKENSFRVAAGDRVIAGQVIGSVGDTGNWCVPPGRCTHLHFQIMAPYSKPIADMGVFIQSGPTINPLQPW